MTALAEFESELIRERTMAGLQASHYHRPAKAPQRPGLPDMQIKAPAGKVVLTGEKVDSGFVERLKRWLATQA